MKPTPEQQDCISKFQTGRRLRINAYAGTGKTTTLNQMARTTAQSGTFLCFNKAIADDAKKKFPSSVTCSTVHSLAFRAKLRSPSNPRGYPIEKLTGNLNGGFAAMKMRYGQKEVLPGFVLKGRGYGHLVVDTVKRWQRSGRPTISLRDVVFEGKLATYDHRELAPLKAELVREAQLLWQRMLDPTHDLPLGHDGYLKLWALDAPQLDGDFVLLDEAQDTNGVVLELARAQRGQLICVGDRFQAIYGWRGAQNAMVELPCEAEARLSMSFRFGAEIAAKASEVLALLGERLPVTGNPAIADRVGHVEKPAVLLFRTNAELIGTLFDMVERSRKPFVVGGVDEIATFVRATDMLMAGQPVERPLEFFGFNTWDEVKIACEEADGDNELKQWMRLVDKYGTAALMKVCEKLPKFEQAADVILCTGHKSKGREWSSVRLAEDFLRGIKTGDDDKPEMSRAEKIASELAGDTPHKHDEELMLYYVAMTRGIEAVELHPKLEKKIAFLQQKYQQKDAAA